MTGCAAIAIVASCTGCSDAGPVPQPHVSRFRPINLLRLLMRLLTSSSCSIIKQRGTGSTTWCRNPGTCEESQDLIAVNKKPMAFFPPAYDNYINPVQTDRLWGLYRWWFQPNREIIVESRNRRIFPKVSG